MSQADSAYEFFWRQRGIDAFDVDAEVAERVRRAREQRRDLFSAGQLRNPWVTVSGDNPIETLSPMQQKPAFERIALPATSEESAIQTGSWPDFISLNDNEEENIENIIRAGGAFPEGERQRLSEDDATALERSRAIDEIISWCEDLDAEGIDGASLMSLLLADESGPIVAAARDTGVDVDGLDQLIQDLEEAFGPSVVIEGIEECRDLLGVPSMERELTEDEILARLRENFDIGAATSFETAVEAVDRQLTEAEQRGEQRVLNRLQRSFGARFEDIDDAIASIQDRIERGRGPTVRSAPITARLQAGSPRIRIDSDDAAFTQFLSNVRREARRQLRLGNLPPTTREIGTIRLEDGELADINLEPGRDLLGAVEGEEPFEPRQPSAAAEAEQVELPAPETPAEEIIDDLIDSLRRGGDR